MEFIKARVFGCDKLDSISVEDTDAILWSAVQSQKVMEELSKHDIKHHPYITSIFFRIQPIFLKLNRKLGKNIYTKGLRMES